MGEWTYRVWGEAPTLEPDERLEVETEIARLRQLFGARRNGSAVRLRKNPTGLLGEYVSLLLDAAVRGRSDGELLPSEVRARYGERGWFAVSLEVLEAFSEQLNLVRAEEAGDRPRKQCQ